MTKRKNIDNGYISDEFLIHWAGRGQKPVEKAKTLSKIITDGICQ